MEENSYPVFLNLKIPFLSKTFFYLFIACAIVLVLFGIYMLPSEHSSDEMKAAYFVLTTSEFEKAVFTYALIGTPIFFILYRYTRIKRKAILTLFENKIEIDNYKTVTSFPIDEITNIACNDALGSDGFPKGKLTIDFKDNNENVTSVTLIDYSQSEHLMDMLLNYKNIKFFTSNFSSNPEVLDS
jgi:hypothetical protein